jgi:hypothetical protein
MKTNTLTRRDFLTAGLKQAKQALHQRAEQMGDQKGSEDKEPGLTPDISSDMTPELLAFEAKRMGLDPEDREGVLKAMQQSMTSK